MHDDPHCFIDIGQSSFGHKGVCKKARYKTLEICFENINIYLYTNFKSQILTIPFTPTYQYFIDWGLKGTKPKGTGQKGPAIRDQAKRDQKFDQKGPTQKGPCQKGPTQKGPCQKGPIPKGTNTPNKNHCNTNH